MEPGGVLTWWWWDHVGGEGGGVKVISFVDFSKFLHELPSGTEMVVACHILIIS